MNAVSEILRDLPERWRSRADELRAFGAEPQAIALERAAQELEEGLRKADCEPLGLHEAALLSGYSPGHLRRMIAEGTLPNAGSRGAPRIMRSHVPRKPGHGVARASRLAVSSRAQVARAVASGG
jgi:hypothetical protein